MLGSALKEAAVWAQCEGGVLYRDAHRGMGTCRAQGSPTDAGRREEGMVKGTGDSWSPGKVGMWSAEELGKHSDLSDLLPVPWADSKWKLKEEGMGKAESRYQFPGPRAGADRGKAARRTKSTRELCGSLICETVLMIILWQSAGVRIS